METGSGSHDKIFKSSDKKRRGRPPLVARPVDFGCNECEKKFKRKVLMKEHMVTAHGKGSRYTCFVCQRGFYSRNHMLRHVKGHEVAMQPEKQYLPEDLLGKLVAEGSVLYLGVQIEAASVCLTCGKVYRNKDSKRKHEEYYKDKETHYRRGTNEDPKPYIRTDTFCVPCDKDFCSDGSKKAHVLKKHSEREAKVKIAAKKDAKSIKCILDCSTTFETSEQLSAHMEVGDHDGIFFFTCSKCPKKFGSTGEMKQHMEDSHGSKKVKEELMRQTKAENTEIKRVVENVVQSQASNEQSIVKSTKMQIKNDPGPKDSNIQIFEFSGVDDQLEEDEEEELSFCEDDNALKYKDYLKCDECGKFLPSESSLQIHIRIHEEQKIHVCKSSKSCTAKFYTLEQFSAHRLSHHGEDVAARSRVKCEVCGKLANTKSELRYHMAKHVTERNFVCIECGLRFKCPRSLKTHALIHTGVKKHKCEQCDFASFTRSNLRTHIRQNHEDLGEHNVCERCGKKCVSAYALKLHVDRHNLESKFKCSTCGAAFKDQQNRRNHELIHDDIKDFTCSICAKQFRQKCQLTTHMKRHNGVRYFK